MEPFKNLIHEQLAFDLGVRVRAEWSGFPTRQYRAGLVGRLEALELKDRAKLVGEHLWACLPGSVDDKFRLLTRTVQALPVIGVDGLQMGWGMFPLDRVLGAYGPQAIDLALDFAREITQRFTAEFGIRSLIEADPKHVLAVLMEWTQDPSVHVRRLVSEGTRPRLPWGQTLKSFVQDPRPTRPLLEALKDDPEEYVRRSVANHWNDITKDHPDYAVEVLKGWWKGASKDRQRLVRHASRSLIKAGHAGCLSMLGYGKPKHLDVRMKLAPKRFRLGGTLEAQVALDSKAQHPQPLILDYRFHFVKANGSTSPKVFKGGSLRLDAHASATLVHRFPLRMVTTRRYYPGKTLVELMINGQPAAQGEFVLIVP